MTTSRDVVDFVNSVQVGPRRGGGYVVPEPIAKLILEMHRDFKLREHSRFDVGHEMILPERAPERRRPA